jgi:hypothetical protein
LRVRSLAVHRGPLRAEVSNTRAAELADTLFYAQGFRRECRRLIADPPTKARGPQEAIATAKRMALRKAGAVAFSVAGDMELGTTDDPVLLFTAGELPRELMRADD